MKTHLNDEHFADLLAGEEPDAAVELHLHTCQACRQEHGSLQSAAAEFNALSYAWAQVEAPRRIHSPTRFERLVSRGGPLWALGLTTAMLIGIISTHIGAPYDAGRRADPMASNTRESAPEELAADNRLMQSINHELQYSAEPAVPVNELRVAAHRIAPQPSAAVEN